AARRRARGDGVTAGYSWPGPSAPPAFDPRAAAATQASTAAQPRAIPAKFAGPRGRSPMAGEPAVKQSPAARTGAKPISPTTLVRIGNPPDRRGRAGATGPPATATATTTMSARTIQGTSPSPRSLGRKERALRSRRKDRSSRRLIDGVPQLTIRRRDR